MQKDEIIIRKAVMHILDAETGDPVLSEQELDLNEDLSDLLRGHIYRIATGDDLKECVFNEGESEVFGWIQEFNEEQLVEVSRNMALRLYDIMNKNIAIPSADFIVVTYQVESTLHMALLKMNYKESFIHLANRSREGVMYNDITKRMTLPAPSQKLTEAVIIRLTDYRVQLIEKKYEVNGTNTNYFSQLFLQCHAKMSARTKMKIVEKTVDEMNKKYFGEDFEQKMEAKKTLQNEIQEKGALVPQRICEEIFNEVPEAKEEFEEKLGKYNMLSEEIVPQNQATTRKLGKQYLTTDTGIEINIPMEEYEKEGVVEFVTNEDGTMSVVIRNINQIFTK